jgi:hypothetical protein
MPAYGPAPGKPCAIECGTTGGDTMGVRAKFVCSSITRNQHWDKAKGEIQTIRLVPVTQGSEENKAFYEATPGGQIDLSTVNAGSYFELGGEYYLDFTRAE